ncbi:MAG: hypothetical protein CBE11_00985 [Rickettsiales bacterium TMED251]|nr:MAG: hypothetical protein CBE11_00985 [Rickettsiales bacterium TMED251]|tara:strand:- start:442 stop:714 length:273 start_codon:yes stop_codon:yes gene_type:complete
MKYLVKYTVYFVQQNISVSDEIEVEQDADFYDFEEKKQIKVKDKITAEKFVSSQYSENEDNVVIIPQSVWDSDDGLTDTELTINSVDTIT